ncbi:MAG: hypothetical protein JXR83_14070 [Deltaproteobacteria bacterium]|nr:hypothetical protein [Deltaproteobacteria bacterium]
MKKGTTMQTTWIVFFGAVASLASCADFRTSPPDDAYVVDAALADAAGSDALAADRAAADQHTSDAGADSGADAGAQVLEIVGNYVDDWGYDHNLTQTEWIDPGDPSDSIFHISQFSNSGQFIIAQNDPANPYTTAYLWSRFDWTYDTGSVLHFCQITYTADSEAAALAATGADRGNLVSGCDGYSWSRLTPALEIRGSYVDDYGFDHEITQTALGIGYATPSLFHISDYDNAGDFLVARNDASNQWDPGRWSRFDWTYGTGSVLHYCQIAYDAASESDARAASGADRGDLAGGCNGFGWSRLIPR